MADDIQKAFDKITQDVKCTCGKVHTVPMTQTETINCDCGEEFHFENTAADVTRDSIAAMQKMFNK